MICKRKIAVFTGNRAEYGLLYPLLKELQNHPQLELFLFVSGAHLEENFGNTIQDIARDGFEIAAEIKIPFKLERLASTPNAIGQTILILSEQLEKIKPDIFVVYADRFESFAATIAASQMSIPVAHIEGGDVTEGGALDDSVRHAITKLSHLHFATNQQAAHRILTMGEEAWRVYTVGFPGIDLIKAGRISSQADIVARYQLNLKQPIIVFTQHSVVAEFSESASHIRQSLTVLKRLASEEVQIIITYPNNDAGSCVIIDQLEEISKQRHENIQVHKSLGQANYFGLLSLAQQSAIRIACVGNSSSGIKETPAFYCPTVNIGSRQRGRLRAVNVLDASYDPEDILKKVKIALFDSEFRKRCFLCKNPYGEGDSSQKILDVLLNISLDSALLKKKMTITGVEVNA